MPRYELRTQHPAASAEALQQRLAAHLGDGTPTRAADIYVFTPGMLDTNVKLRQGRLDVKELIALSGSLEQWRALDGADFPLTPGWLQYLSTRCGFPRVVSASPTVGGFLDAAERSHEVLVAHVHKERHHFQQEGLSAEVTTGHINGASVAFLVLESEIPERVMEVARQLQIENLENVSLPRFLQRLFGVLPLPPGDPARADGQALGDPSTAR
jgi:hypothetical protein